MTPFLGSERERCGCLTFRRAGLDQPDSPAGANQRAGWALNLVYWRVSAGILPYDGTTLDNGGVKSPPTRRI